MFVGGSLVPAGGHNILEPAVFGKAIVFGPRMDNFREVASLFVDRSAALQVSSPTALSDALSALLGDPVRRASLGAAARALIDANKGARFKTLKIIAGILPPGAPDLERDVRTLRAGSLGDAVLSRVYGTLAVRRRRWYETRPEVRLRLRRPVVSVGSLVVGGSGKTPIAADVATVLVSMGERPALLSRGYRRIAPIDGVVVVSERGVVKADLRQAGDEPFMLAARLAEVSVLVAEDRYLAGRLAEERLGASVHLLDDGFQHLSLHRDVDLLVMGDGDLADPRTLPGGRLREPPETTSRADALVVEAADREPAHALAVRLGVSEAFHFVKALGPPRDAADQEREVADGTRLLAVAGIAKPQSFVDDLRTSGYDVVDLIQVRDHHQYSRKDVSGIADRAVSLGVDYVITTEKDLVRLQLHAPFAFPLMWVPLKVMVQPADHFRSWLIKRLAAARGQTSETSLHDS